MANRKKRLRKQPFNHWIWKDIDDYSHRIEVYYGGAGSGKSHGALQKILLKSLNFKRRVLVVRKVSRTLKDSVFAVLCNLIVQAGQMPFCSINRTHLEIVLGNGSVFLFKGLDDPEKIKSIADITDIVVEEATELTKNDFLQLDLRLRSCEPFLQIYVLFNPVSKTNWVYHYFFVEPPQNAKIIHSTYQNNRFLPAEYVSTLNELKQRNEHYYRVYALGEFATLDKLVFPHIHKQIVSAEKTQHLPLFVGLDFGYTFDPSALIYGRYDKQNKRIYITGEYFKKGMLNNELAEVIVALGLAKERIVADSARPDSIMELRSVHGISRIEGSKKGPDSVLHGIAFLQQHDIVVDERLTGLITEFENYTWRKSKQTGEYENQPTDCFNHGIDALRYAMEQFHQNRQISVLSKTLFHGKL